MSVIFTIDQSKRSALSPYVLSANRDVNGCTSVRAGGNRWSCYNYENNASNSGVDETGTGQHQNDGWLSRLDAPGPAGAVISRMRAAKAAGAQAFLATVPMLGYVAADLSPTGDVIDSGVDYITRRFRVSVAREAGAPAGAVVQERYVRLIAAEAARLGLALWISLDNEPGLWDVTHSRVHPAHATYAELLTKTVEYASMVKAVAPDALVFGPVSYGWAGWERLRHGVAEAPDAAGRSFLDVYLTTLAAEERRSDRRLLDVLDVHSYTAAQYGNVTNPWVDTAETRASRLQAPRELWDPTFVDRENWISRDALGGQAMRLIPRLLERIEASYPGTKLAITEYSWGGAEDITGAIAQADALGAMGREGVFAAFNWEMRADQPNAFTWAAMRAFVGDAASGSPRFGATGLAATSSDPAQAAVYVSVDAEGRTVVVAINRTDTRLEPAWRGIAGEAARWILAAPTGPVLASIPPVLIEASILPPLSVTVFLLARAVSDPLSDRCALEISADGEPWRSVGSTREHASVRVRALDVTGLLRATGTLAWTDAPVVPPEPPPPPPPSGWTPVFLVGPPLTASENWLEVRVPEAERVEVLFGGVDRDGTPEWRGPWIAMSPHYADVWALGVHTPAGTPIRFRAFRGNESAMSEPIEWLQ